MLTKYVLFGIQRRVSGSFSIKIFKSPVKAGNHKNLTKSCNFNKQIRIFVKQNLNSLRKSQQFWALLKNNTIEMAAQIWKSKNILISNGTKCWLEQGQFPSRLNYPQKTLIVLTFDLFPGCQLFSLSQFSLIQWEGSSWQPFSVPSLLSSSQQSQVYIQDMSTGNSSLCSPDLSTLYYFLC